MMAIETEGLYKFYGTTRVVGRLDLAVPAGITFGFLGPNGAGKPVTELGHLRALREPRRRDVAGPEGAARTRAEEDHGRPLATVFGQVTVNRIAYRAPGLPNVHVMDEELNLPGEKHSHGLRKLAAIEAPRGSYDAAAAAITRATGVTIGKRQAEELAMRAAVDVDAFYEARKPAPAPADQVLMLQADGKGIVMREESLRPATAKAAAAAKRKVKARLSPGEKNGRKRMAEVIAVADVIPAPRAPADIIGPPGRDRADPPKTQGKWLAASVTNDIPAAIAGGFDDMDRRDPGHQRTWIAILDGNNTQIDAVNAEATTRGVTVPILIDFIHVANMCGKQRGRSSNPVTPTPRTGPPTGPPPSSKAKPPTSPRGSGAAPPPTATARRNAKEPAPAPATSTPRPPTWTTPPPSPAAGRSPPGSSKEHAGT